jgi:hypothetical protein
VCWSSDEWCFRTSRKRERSNDAVQAGNVLSNHSIIVYALSNVEFLVKLMNPFFSKTKYRYSYSQVVNLEESREKKVEIFNSWINVAMENLVCWCLAQETNFHGFHLEQLGIVQRYQNVHLVVPLKSLARVAQMHPRNRMDLLASTYH